MFCCCDVFEQMILVLGNPQVISLQTAIKEKLEKDGLKGMAVAGGAVLAVGAIVGLGITLLSRTASK